MKNFNSKFDLVKKSLSLFLPKSTLGDVTQTITSCKRFPSFRINTLKCQNESETLKQLSNKYNSDLYQWSIFPKAYSLIPKDATANSTIFHSDATKNGDVYFQSLSSMLPAICMGIKPHMNVLDLCAAPGGKTTLMCEKMKYTGYLLAIDKDDIRINKLLQTLRVLIGENDTCVTVVKSDARYLKINDQGLPHGPKSDFQDNIVTMFDRVLLDAPCTGSGTWLMQDPKHLKVKSIDLESAALRQKKLLMAGIRNLKPGGTLMYATCSIFPEENEEIIDWLLKCQFDIDLEDVKLDNGNKLLNDLKGEAIPGLTSYGDKNYSKILSKAVRILPSKYYEGFFLARLVKRS